MQELWNELIEMFNASKRKIHIYPGTEEIGRKEIEKIGINKDSVLGTVLLHTAGICIDNWIRIFGQQCAKHNGLLQYNLDEANNNASIMEGMLLIAQDVVGGMFAINLSKFEENVKQVWYFAPDTLEWESLDMNYAEFIAWTVQGNVDEFYSSMRWKTWEADCLKLNFDRAYLIYPFLWSQECDLETATIKEVAVNELRELNMEYAKKSLNSLIR